jgi:hypothetical protein
VTGLFKINFKKDTGMKGIRHFQGNPAPCNWETLIDQIEVHGVDRIESIKHYDGKPNENRAPLDAKEMLKLWKAVHAFSKK